MSPFLVVSGEERAAPFEASPPLFPDFRTAWEIVRGAGRGNGGLLVDRWHFFRRGSTLQERRAIPGDKVLGVQ
jgi:hypothetical protein